MRYGCSCGCTTMKTLLVSFFPARAIATCVGIIALILMILRMFNAKGPIIMVISFTVAGGSMALLGYYIAMHDKITGMVSEQVVLGFISKRPYGIESFLKRSEAWSELATDANLIVERKYNVKRYFSAEQIESLLNNAIDLKNTDTSVPQPDTGEVAGWQRVLLVARNIRNEDQTAYWSSRVPADVMSRYS